MITARNEVPEVDREHHITSAELAYLRGPYVRRPNEHASGREWVRWAEEIAHAYQSAKLILDAQAARHINR